MSATRRVRRALAACAVSAGVAAALAVAPVQATAATQAAAGTTYYVNACKGKDNAKGTSSNHPWKSLTKVNARTFKPGDSVLFRAGCTWEGQLWPKGSGT
ncbi:right-handed parallel beta-helix repeat-containing protein, partial [Streptomyces sp. NPDC003832]